MENNTDKNKKKEFRRMITARIEAALADLQGQTKEKKFKAAIRRACKLLANDLYTKPKKEKLKKEKNGNAVPVNLGA